MQGVDGVCEKMQTRVVGETRHPPTYCKEWMGACQEIHAGEHDGRDKAHTLVLLRHLQTLSTLVARTQRRMSLVTSGI